jgi:hypothetical protein
MRIGSRKLTLNDPFFVPEIHRSPFDSDSDNDPDPDCISTNIAFIVVALRGKMVCMAKRKHVPILPGMIFGRNFIRNNADISPH